ncbi:YeeE/YedE family protein [Photobacterium japonica]|uniref:DUF6691 family protein n=1 Tax=Photobacterium japonica TaxID=2910235 RepID=UPI003D142073
MSRLTHITALASGLLFGMGMMLSGMVDPNKVIGFLDVAGAWDPSLAFVMGGALLVFMPMYFFVIRPRQKPVCASAFSVSTKTQMDKRLLIGAGLFGIGWGVAGICPGPVVTALPSLNSTMWVFFIAMLVGMKAVTVLDRTAAAR